VPESLDYLITPPETPAGETLSGGGSNAWSILGLGDLGFMVLGDGIPWAAIDEDGDPWPIEPGQFDPTVTAEVRVWKQFEGTVTWASLVGVFGQAFNDVEIVEEQLQPMRYVGTATGVWLDEIGANVGRARGGQTDDDEYRLAIIADALSQVTDGSPDEIIDLAVRLKLEASVVRYDEPVPAVFVLTVTELDAARFDLMRDVMGDMPPAGVGAWLDTYDEALAGGPSWGTAIAGMGAPGWDPQPAGVRATHGWGAEIG
jgi:hypothetical protein